MKTFRQIIFWLHLAVGVCAGAIILVMSVTGVLLAFERQIIALVESGYRVSPAGERQSVETILAKLPAQSATGIVVQSDPGASLAVNFGRERTVFVNLYDGSVLGEGAKRTRAFFHTVTDVHRWLAAEGEKRAIGKAVTGACNAAFVVLVISGFYLWWPRQWSLRSLRGITWFSRGLRGKARDWNWHNTIGFWSAPVLIFITLTGLLISYPWATNLLYRLTGNDPPPPRTEQRGERAPAANVSWSGSDKLLARAQQQVTGWQTITVRFAASPSAPVTFTIDRGHRGRPDLRGQLTLDPKTGAVVKWETFSSYNLGRQLRTWARWVHTGEAGGILGQIAAALASAGGAFLVWTGLALSWRRFFGKKREAVAVAASPVVPEVADVSK